MTTIDQRGQSSNLSAAHVDQNLQYLHAALARLDVTIQRAVRRWQLAGQDPTDTFRGLRTTDDEAVALLLRPLASNWGDTIEIDEAAETYFQQAEQAAQEAVNAIEQTAARDNQPLRLPVLAQIFQLDPFDLDALLICLAPAVDLRYERIYGYLQDDVTRKRPGVNLILDLLVGPGLPRLSWLSHFMPDAPLLHYRLLEPIGEADAAPLNQTLAIDPAIVMWLLGGFRPHRDLGEHAELAAAADHPIDQLLADEIQADLARAAIEKPIVVLRGTDRAGQLGAARVLARQLQRPLLQVQLNAVLTERLTPLQAVRLALRDACLSGALLCLAGWDACLQDGAPLPKVLEELCAFEEPVILISQALWQARGLDRDRLLMWIDFPIPAYAQRRALWAHFLHPIDPGGPALNTLAGQFLLTSAQIRDAVATAKDAAAQRGGAVNSQDLLAAARAHSSPTLSGMAHKINPRYTWQDIVLPDDQIAVLHEIIATVRGRPIVLEDWGVGRKLAASNGVTVLFSGPPGTGKTMAAEVIAGELGLDLYKIDLSTVINKYIGETEKNLGRIFDEASNSNAILFFDEADALFGKRSEVKDNHDRYANVEVSYLLQRMEAYDGITVLVTNLRANMDEAFKRRLHFAVDFPFPDEAYRLRIWQTLFPPEVPRANDLDFALLARRFKLAGGNIRNIIVSAAYLAATDGGMVSMDHLLHGVRRELQKMGRLVSDKDLAV